MLTLTPLGYDDLHRVATVNVAPDQIKFSGTVREAFDAPQAGVDLHGIFLGGQAIGFFKLDRSYHERHPFAGPSDLGLRAFIIDLAMQGQGLGSAASAALPDYVRTLYPDAQAIYLTVNLANPAARRAYLKGGFFDTGNIWPHGEAGPQNILKLPVTPL